MNALSRDQFVACLKKSRAIDEEAVDSWMSRVDDEDPKKIATKLVRDKMLTKWQAKLLLSGRSRLTLGNYRLLSRINRNDLGDRFEAIHSQLGRKVVIQIFPSSINKDDELRGRVLQAMQKMTELDHTGLVHVYDVDQEGDRYFVVTEFIDGTPLSELPRGDLKDSDVASVIADLITGVKYAHGQGVIHGSILQDNVLMTTQSRGKLQGLPTSAVRCEMSDSSGNLSHQQDFVAISKLGCSVLQEVPPKRRGEGYDALVKIVDSLASGEGSDLEKIQLKLAQWLAKHGRKTPVATLDDAGPVSKSARSNADLSLARPVDPSSAEQGGFDAPVAVLPGAKLTKKKKAEPTPEPEPAGFLAKMWNEKRALSLAAIAATALMLLGGVGVAGYSLTSPASTSGGNANAVAKKDRNGVKQASLAASQATPKSPVKPLKQPKEFKLEKLAQGDGLLSAARTKDALDPEATKRKFEEMYAKRNASVNKPPAGKPKVEPKLPTKTKAASDTAKASKPVVPKPKETQTVAATKTPKQEPKVVETAMAKPAAKPAKKNQKPAADKGNPFAKLPEAVDLPLSTETGDLKIADLTIDKRYLMGLELLAGPEICKHKFVFDLKRSANDKQLWDVRMQRRKRDEPLPVAQIQKTPTEVKFRWLPAAEKFDDANYIRNCKIRLSAGKDFAWIGLRQPVEIQNFAFESGRTSMKTDFDLTWLPNPQVVRIELDPFKAEERDGEHHRGRVFFGRREVVKKAPGLIFFRENQDLRFFFIEVGVEIRSKLRMQAQMFALGTDGKPRPLKKPTDFLQLANILDARKTEAERYQAAIVQAKNKAGIVQVFPNLKDQGDYKSIAGKANKAAALATRQKETCDDYVKIIENLAGLKIPFQVFFDMDGHRIKLAQSYAD